MINERSNNKLSDIRGIINGDEGKNYAFDDCMAFLMERLGENPKLDYWTFTWITGDGLTQVYNRNQSILCEYCVSGYFARQEHIDYVFDAIGYGYTYVTAEQINADKEKYIQKVMDYIDKDIPVLVKTTMADTPVDADVRTHCLFVGYEEEGNTLLFISDYDNIFKYDTTDIIKQDWIFVGEKKRVIAFEDIILNSVRKMQYWLTLSEKNGKFFGAAAFRAWADDIENDRYKHETDLWANYGVYFCNMATNSWANNISDAPHASLINKFVQMHLQFTVMKDKIAEQYFKIGNGDGAGGIWKDLENLGGGFNVNHEALRDKEKRTKIADKIREAADCLETVVRILKQNI